MNLRLKLALVPLSLVLLAACESDPKSTTPDAAVGDVSPATDTAGSETTCPAKGVTPTAPVAKDPACTLTADLVGKTLLVDYMKIEEPANQALLDSLNPLWERDIKEGALILLFHITAVDTATGKATIEAGTGKDDCGTYRWLNPPNVLDVQLTGCDFATTKPAKLEFKPETVNKPIIVSKLDVAGQFKGDGSRIVTADLSGGIKEADATGLMVLLNESLPPVELAELLHSFSIPLDSDTDGNGSFDAWTLSGKIAARVVTNVDLP